DPYYLGAIQAERTIYNRDGTKALQTNIDSLDGLSDMTPAGGGKFFAHSFTKVLQVQAQSLAFSRYVGRNAVPTDAYPRYIDGSWYLFGDLERGLVPGPNQVVGPD